MPRIAVRTPADALALRVERLGELLALLCPVPEEWLKEQPRAAGGDGDVLGTLECRRYDVLVDAWRRALRWTDGLDHALAVMLASCASVKGLDDQLWFKIIGPASCLHGNVPIHDPSDGTIKTVYERWQKGEKFSVYSLMPDGQVGIVQALPPQRSKPELMYQVSFASGRTIRVTGGHRFWNGSSYVVLDTVVDELQRCGAYPLPSISDACLLARRQGGPHYTKIGQGSRSDYRACFCFHGERPLRGVGIAPSVFPSPDDAPERSQPNYGGGGVGNGCRYTHLQIARPANADAYCPSLWPRPGDEWGFCIDEDTCAQCSCSFASSLRSDRQIGRNDTALPSSGPFSAAREHNDTRYFARVAPSIRGLARPSSAKRSPLEKIPVGKGPHTSQSFPGPISLPRFTSIMVESNRYGPITLTDSIVSVKPCGSDYYYDFHVPETRNYWACGVFHHNCGKSELCEALSTARKYVLPVSTLRGFHSGYERPDGKDCNLISQLNGMTLVTKDGDTLLQAPNLPQILSEARDLYDGTARSHYRTGVGKSWEGVRFTWLLGGTSALRAIDSSELGERFLDCVIVERIDEDLEDEIQWHVVNRVIGHLGVEADGTPESRIGPELADARSLTGGYVEWLREHGTKLLGRVVVPRSVRLQVMRLAKFVALMRARPSARQDETAEREMAPRLTIQLTRLATYLPVVLNREEVDSPVMARVRRVALDTARGQTLALVSLMAGQGELGDVVASMALVTNKREEHTRSLLRFLREIGVCEPYQHRTTRGLTKTQIRWRLTRRMAALYREVMRDA